MRKALARIDSQMDDLLTSMEKLEHGMHVAAMVSSSEPGMHGGGTLPHGVQPKEQPSAEQPRPSRVGMSSLPDAAADGKQLSRSDLERTTREDVAQAEEEEAFLTELLQTEQRRSAGLERELVWVRALIKEKQLGRLQASAAA